MEGQWGSPMIERQEDMARSSIPMSTVRRGQLVRATHKVRFETQLTVHKHLDDRCTLFLGWRRGIKCRQSRQGANQLLPLSKEGAERSREFLTDHLKPSFSQALFVKEVMLSFSRGRPGIHPESLRQCSRSSVNLPLSQR